MKSSQKLHVPEPLAQHAAGDLREPVVERAEQREHGAADQHVVKMRDDEEGVVHLRDRAAPTASITPVRPPMMKIEEEAEDPQHRRLERAGVRDHIVAIQQKICMPVGIAIMMLAAVKKLSPSCGRPVANMWWTHSAEAHERGRDQREHHRRGSRRSCRRENVAMIVDDHPERRNEDDVDLGMAEEPEQVLPQQRVAAFRLVEEVRADQAIEDQARCSRASPPAWRRGP